MREFDYSKLKNKLWDNEILGYCSVIHEAKGKQELYLKQKTEELERLVEVAKIQSTEASNSIEGIKTTNSRLKQLCHEKTSPRNRDEEEIAGYRDALNIIHENFEYIPLTVNYILQLHKILYSHQNTNIGGKFKNVQNYISATNKDGEIYTLFVPLAPYETPSAIQKICDEFNRAVSDNVVDPLILIPIFIHDFLCIHPFVDGNGRMSRLLTTLLLYRCGYHVGKYISLEAKILKNKSLYYDSLVKSQEGWHDNADNPEPFIKYLLGTIISAYRDLEERFEIVSGKVTSLEIIRRAINMIVGKFTKSQLLELCPSLSLSTVEGALRKLVENNEIERHGVGKSIFYTKKN